MNEWMDERGWSTDGPNSKYSEKTLSRCHFVQYNLQAQAW